MGLNPIYSMERPRASVFNLQKKLPPMQNSFYDKLDPLKCCLTVPSDRAKIEELLEILRPYFKTVSKVGYEGSQDSNGKMSGKGIYRFESGGVYDGEAR
jgi:hypothetical protein